MSMVLRYMERLGVITISTHTEGSVTDGGADVVGGAAVSTEIDQGGAGGCGAGGGAVVLIVQSVNRRSEILRSFELHVPEGGPAATGGSALEGGSREGTPRARADKDKDKVRIFQYCRLSVHLRNLLCVGEGGDLSSTSGCAGVYTRCVPSACALSDSAGRGVLRICFMHEVWEREQMHSTSMGKGANA